MNLQRNFYQKGKENRVYIFDCETHEKVDEFYNRNYTDIKNYTLKASNRLGSKFLYEKTGRYCYARKVDEPNNKEYDLGKKIKVKDELGNDTVFPCIFYAAKVLGLHWKTLSKAATGGTVKPFYLKNKKRIYYTATFV